MISKTRFGDQDSRYGDVLGSAYEHSLFRFASAEAKGGGDFHTPDLVVRLLV